MANKHGFHLQIDLNVINHLGIGLYSSTPAALTELVANAWDAEASEVRITIDSNARTICIEDDGHGMNAHDVKDKFLNVGYSRRRHSPNKDRSYRNLRKVMGRKGIGKLSMFALANLVKITTQMDGAEAVGFEINVPQLKSDLERNTAPELNDYIGEPLPKGHGTRILLEQVLSGLNTTEGYLRTRLARRFSILGALHGFHVHLNGAEITKTDRGFYRHVQFLWGFDQASLDEVLRLSTNIAKIETSNSGPKSTETCATLLDSKLLVDNSIVSVTGYVASAFKPKDLGSKEDSANMLSVFANGRVFAENVLDEANSAKYYQSYLVGEIHADFLDDDDVDRATASREAIKKDDPRYQALITFIRKTLESIGDQWDEWRMRLGLDPNDQGNAAINEWLEGFSDKRDEKLARRLMTSIKNATVHSDETKNEAAKKILYKGAIIGFEKLKIKKQLDDLVSIADVLSPEFAALFASLNSVEETAYAEITNQRLEIIKKFQAISSDPSALEKVAQKYLFEHLWLLDPTWDRATGRGEMEVTLTKYIKDKDPDSTGARLDIAYRASSGRHIVVELKRPKLTSLKFDDLFTQVRKYKSALDEYYRKEQPNTAPPPIDIYVLVGKAPTGFEESDRRALAEKNGKIITYQELITNAINSYQAYLDTVKLKGSLDGILKRI